MPHLTYSQQAPSRFNCNTIDEQTVAQSELYNHLEAQAQAVAPTTDPLTDRDRRIIATIIDHAPESIRTIWIEAGITVWVQLVDSGRLPFERNWFASRVQEVKATLPETPRERNERLSAELEQACIKFGLTHGQIDWLSFSTTLYLNRQPVGFIGYNRANQWYSRRNQLGGSRTAKSVDAAIASLGVRQPVAA
ncbi:hypothetical protein [Dendronalium sp. ChiSLP03b]|uniref:hypothetical protein n=1 Tax=Dendronalium sp. ChiSLP03b TaxID=3075381 RepID=UPI002AD54D1A|nr:hypothetical protein [Dendronalium sp. ChiSLP03b]MDZ8209334.1 hypothetical protein [Dendronalium sp. ChiSLP03b]